MRRPAHDLVRWVAPAVAALVVGCRGEVSPIGLDEPIRVQDGDLRTDAFPGAPAADGPRVTSIESTGGIWVRGQPDRTLGGRVTEDTFAVGLRIADRGSGWWVVQVDGLDPAFPGERSWDVRLDVGGGLAAGVHTLVLVAIDERGRGGAWSELEVCVSDPRVPDNFNACDPTIAPPDAAIVLTWETTADLDLVVVTPDGKTVRERSPTTALPDDGGTVPPDRLRDPTVGRLAGDSLSECQPDGRFSEALVWQEPTQVPGRYDVFVDLFDACGASSVRFAVTTHRRVDAGDGLYDFAEVDRRTGVALRLAASGGATQPLYLGSVFLP